MSDVEKNVRGRIAPTKFSDGVIRHVSDTSLWVAHYRAVETERPDALFRDPFAKLLAGESGREIARKMTVSGKYTQWTVVIRTVIIDRFIEKLIADGIDAVVNLGAGMDTRPYRMSLPDSLKWIEVDHSPVIDHKEEILKEQKPRCRLERVPLDLADRDKRKFFLSDLSSRYKKILVLTEGVLPYLTPTQVAELAEDLRASPGCRYWITEYFHKTVYRYLGNSRRMKRMKNAPFQFFPEDWMGFFKSHGWNPVEVKYVGEETEKLGRKSPAPWFFHVMRWFLSQKRLRQMRQMSGFVVFESAGP